MKKLSNKDSGWLEFRLVHINPLFGEMWKRFEPMALDEEAETAQLEIHKDNFRIVANPKFWKERSEVEQLFIICHEMCHVMFGHWLINPKLKQEWVNIAQDIQVNEYLLREYFNKKNLKYKDFVTIEYVFKHKAHVVEKNRDYMYYYKLLMECL